MSDGKRAISYLRVSTDDQELGLDAQRAAIRRWCESNGTELAREYVDQGVSGTVPLDRRPGLLDALGSVRRLRAGVLVVAKRDRLARDVVVGAVVERAFDRAGVSIVSADGTANGEGPEHVLFRNLVNAIAQYERALIASRTRAALAEKRVRGERLGGTAPFGFRYEGGRRIEEPREQPILRRMLELRECGATVREIRDALDREFGAHPRTGRAWRQHGVWKVLRTAVKRAS